MISMRIVIKRVVNSYKHKGCKMKTTKIKITTPRKVASNCNKEKGEGRWQSTWGPWSRGLQIATSTRFARFRPLRSKSWWLGRSIVVTMKRRERKTMINMRTVTKRVVGSYKHKKCKTMTTKINIRILGRSPTIVAKKEETWSVWASSDSALKPYQ